MGVLASQAPYGLGATTVALVRRGQPLTAEAHGECTDPTAHGCSVRHDQGADCSMRGTKGQAAEPACFLLDFKDFLLSRNGKGMSMAALLSGFSWI